MWLKAWLFNSGSTLYPLQLKSSWLNSRWPWRVQSCDTWIICSRFIFLRLNYSDKTWGETLNSLLKPMWSNHLMSCDAECQQIKVCEHAGWPEVKGSGRLSCRVGLTFVLDVRMPAAQIGVLVLDGLQPILSLLPLGHSLALGTVQLPLLDVEFVQLLLNSGHVQTSVQHVLGVCLLLFQLHGTEIERRDDDRSKNMSGVCF